jgi:hypothetical protein
MVTPAVDGLVRTRNFVDAIRDILMLRSARRARLETRATVMQLFAHFLHTLFLGNDGAKPIAFRT